MPSSPVITIIGAGGVTFPIRLILDILSFEALRPATLRLMDISLSRARRTARLAQEIIAAHQFPTRLEVTTDRTAALRGAGFVIIAFQVGGSEAYRIDKEIPRRYGLDLCVGDTLNAGGIFRGLRSLAALDAIADDLHRHSPDALVLNYANPMAINCWGLLNRRIRAVGLCHSVQGTTEMLAGRIGVPYEDVVFKCSGINHQAWITEFRTRGGRDLFPQLVEAMLRQNPSPLEKRARARGGKSRQPEGGGLAVDHGDHYYQEAVRAEILRTFGAYQTESPHHASEYVPWFRKDEATIKAYIRQRWDYYDICANYDLEGQIQRTRAKLHEPLACSKEFGAPIIHAVQTHHPLVIYGNVPNWGPPGSDPAAARAHLIPNLPQHCCVEVACLVDGNGVQPTAPGPLPPQLAAINRTNINVQELTVRAHETRNPACIEQAVALDPLTGAKLTLPQVRSLVRDMLAAQQRWLPQFRKRKNST